MALLGALVWAATGRRGQTGQRLTLGLFGPPTAHAMQRRRQPPCTSAPT
ncbi:MAG: hypothetical protein WKG07_19965 [Hymenobacter sp.]